MLGAFLLLVAGFALTNPLYTFDTVPYVAATLAPQFDSSAALHQATYALLAQELNGAEFNALTAGPYAADLYQNSAHFASQLNMYLVKPLYVLSLRMLHGLGLNPLDALLLMSLLPGLLICVILFTWLQESLSPVNASIVVVVFAIAARLPDLCRVPVPDNLSALLIVTALYCLLVRRSLALMSVLLALAVLVRTNNIIFAGLLLSLSSWYGYAANADWRRREFLWPAAGLLLAAVLYLITSVTYDQQWWRLYFHTFVQSQTDIDSFALDFAPAVYLQVLRDALAQLFAGGAFLPSGFPVFLLMLLIAMSGRWRQGIEELIAPDGPITPRQVALLCLPVFIAFLLLFPLVAGWDRFFTPFYAVITVFLVSSLASRPASP